MRSPAVTARWRPDVVPRRERWFLAAASPRGREVGADNSVAAPSRAGIEQLPARGPPPEVGAGLQARARVVRRVVGGREVHDAVAAAEHALERDGEERTGAADKGHVRRSL